MNKRQKIERIMAGSYEPSQSDVIRIYNQYRVNTGEIAGVLADVFGWLAQEPIERKYKGGTIYARAEADTEETLVVHYIYDKKKRWIDGKIGNEEDITDKTLIYYVREIEHQIDELLSEEKDC